MSNYSPKTTVRISQRQRNDLRPSPAGWHFFPRGGPVAAGPLFETLLDALAWPELADRRRFAKPLDGPWAPLIDSKTGRPGELDLRAVRTIVYTPEPGGPREVIYAARRERMTSILNAFGFSNWRFHYGSHCVPYCARHCADHAQFCRVYDPPLFVMEDDAEPAWPCSHLVPPVGADRLHIGGDTHGVELARLLASKTRPDWRRNIGYLWRPYDRDWFWEAGMLAYHAVLYLTRRVMDAVADYVPQRTGAIDASVAELDCRFNVACPTRCWWWQNDGHNGEWSFDFCPPELQPRGYQRNPP